MAHTSMAGGICVHGRDAVTVRIEPRYRDGHHWLAVYLEDEDGVRIVSISIYGSDERRITVEDLRGLAKAEAAE